MRLVPGARPFSVTGAVPTNSRSTNTDAPGTSDSTDERRGVGAVAPAVGAAPARRPCGAWPPGGASVADSGAAGSGAGSAVLRPAPPGGPDAARRRRGRGRGRDRSSRIRNQTAAPATSKHARPRPATSGVRLGGALVGVSSKTLTRQMVACSPQPIRRAMAEPLSILCIASYHKGQEFLREAKRQGARVYLVTSESLRDADWPRESLDDIFFVHDDDKRWMLDDLILGASHLARRIAIDRVVPLDDFDLEKAVGAARAPARAGHGRDHHPLLPRQAGDAACAPTSTACSCRRFVHVLNEARVARVLRRACRRRGC